MSELSQQDQDLLFRMAQKITSCNVDNRPQIIINNVRRRMSLVHRQIFKDYLQLILSDASEMHQFISAITIHTTSWFRESEHFRFLRTNLESRLKQSSMNVKILSAGCSTGQEVYTLGLVCEDIRSMYPSFEYEILGLDVDPISLAHGRRADYHQAELKSVPSQLHKWLTKKEHDTFTVSEAIKRRCHFQVANLNSYDWANQKFDFIFCRNVLIYFDQETQIKLVNIFADHLRPQGIVCLGHSESFSPEMIHLKYVEPSIYRANQSSLSLSPQYPTVKRPSAPMKVLVVDDDDEVCQTIVELVELQNCAVESACSVDDALVRMCDQKFDLVLTDFRMPQKDGIALISDSHKLYPATPVVMISAYGDVELSQRALAAGAKDVLSKPVDLEDIRKVVNRYRPVTEVQDEGGGVELILIGASTGGPEALVTLLRDMPADLPPVVIVQHIKGGFEESLRVQIEESAGLKTMDVSTRQVLQRGHIYLAQAETQVGLIRSAREEWRFLVDLSTGAVSGHRPSVDYLFQNVSRLGGHRVLACLLTGMGRDGADGLLKLKNAGAYTMAQDEKSSVVFGMPRAAIELGAPHLVANLEGMRAQLIQRCSTGKFSDKKAI